MLLVFSCRHHYRHNYCRVFVVARPYTPDRFVVASEEGVKCQVTLPKNHRILLLALSRPFVRAPSPLLQFLSPSLITSCLICQTIHARTFWIFSKIIINSSTMSNNAECALRIHGTYLCLKCFSKSHWNDICLLSTDLVILSGHSELMPDHPSPPPQSKHKKIQ